MIGTKNLVYWDTGIFLAWIADKNRDPKEMAAIQQQVHQFDSSNLFICTSVITITEVLQSQLSEGANRTFKAVLLKQNFRLANVDRKVAEIAHDIRNFYSKEQDTLGETLSTPDALHLATAIRTQCDAMYTFDAKVRPGKSRPLLPLSGTIANKYFMRIEKP